VNIDYSSAKDEYLKFLLKLINEHPKIPDDSYEHASELDQEAMFNVINEYYHLKILTPDDLFHFSSEVIKIDKNPRVTLLAYCGITHYYLDKTNLKDAVKTADAALLKYDDSISWAYFKEHCYMNSGPAIMCFEYLFQKGAE
jgi:hypothetical protein